jgi:hypothetical protein
LFHVHGICREKLEDNGEFQVIADPEQLKPTKPEEEAADSTEPQPSTSKPNDEISLEDDCNVIFHNGTEEGDEDGTAPSTSQRKRSMSGEAPSNSAAKKARLSGGEDDIIEL